MKSHFRVILQTTEGSSNYRTELWELWQEQDPQVHTNLHSTYWE